jgi:hypothetical protein
MIYVMNKYSWVWINKGNNKLPNSEQSNKGKVKAHKYINSQQPENCENRNDILKRQTFRFHYGSKVPAVIITVSITILEYNNTPPPI